MESGLGVLMAAEFEIVSLTGIWVKATTAVWQMNTAAVFIVGRTMLVFFGMIAPAQHLYLPSVRKGKPSVFIILGTQAIHKIYDTLGKLASEIL